MLYFFASSFFASIIPWRASTLPPTAIGTFFSLGLSAHSTDAKNPLQSQCSITLSNPVTSLKENGE
jgi:hypothetical protein